MILRTARQTVRRDVRWDKDSIDWPVNRACGCTDARGRWQRNGPIDGLFGAKGGIDISLLCRSGRDNPNERTAYTRSTKWRLRLWKERTQ